jgi:hypothetical protein
MNRIAVYRYCLLSLLSVACAKDQSIQGFDELDISSRRGTVAQKTIAQLSKEITFSDTLTNTGASPSLLLGEFDLYATQILLRFRNFEGVSTAGDITAATVVLKVKSNISDDVDTTAFTVSIHEVTADWNPETVTSENFQNAFAPAPFGQDTVKYASGTDSPGVPDSLLLAFNASGLELVDRWRMDSSGENNFGILLDFSMSRFIKEFHSINSAFSNLIPYLIVETTAGASVTTASVVSTADVYLVTGNGMPEIGPLLYLHGPRNKPCYQTMIFLYNLCSSAMK